MGKYAIILVISLIILLSYFVISSNRANTIATERNIETYAYNQAKNVSNSAAQIIVREIMEVKPSSRWNYLMNTEMSSINPPPYYSDWRDWSELEGRYRIKSIAKSVEFDDDILLVVSGEAHDRVYDTRVHLVRRTNQDPYFNYAVYARNRIDINQLSYVDSYNSDNEPWNYKGEHQNGNIAVQGPYVDDKNPIDNAGEVFGEVEYGQDKYLPVIEDPGGGSPLDLSNDINYVTEGVYRVTTKQNISGKTGLDITGDVTIIFEDDVVINSDQGIVINEDSSLTIYQMGGSFRIQGGGVINKTNKAANLMILGGPECEEVYLAGGSDVTACVYAPEADVTITGTSAGIFGAVVGNNVTIWGNMVSSMHYDEALMGIESDWVFYKFKYYVHSWE